MNTTELLQNLLRYDTTNPPGNEKACILFIQEYLQQHGLFSELYSKDANRPNLICRIQGNGALPPLLLYGHVDVVPTANQEWKQPPFSGEIVDGFVWGRGALDMKGGVAMLIQSFLTFANSETPLPFDIVLTILSDEEAGSDFGAGYLVKTYPEIFKDIKYAIGEFGGFTFPLGGKKFYPIMVAEKQVCWIEITINGPGGHGSLPLKNGAMATLGNILTRLNTTQLPPHITEIPRIMINSICDVLPLSQSLILRQLLNPKMTNPILRTLGKKLEIFEPLLHHSINPTIVQGGDKINVIPGEIKLKLDGRILPGFTPDSFLEEIRTLISDEVEMNIIRFDEGAAHIDLKLFEMLAGVLRSKDPDAIPIPLMLSGVTDGRFFSKLGIQTYGFLPMQLPAEMNFTSLIHAANERIPIDTLDFGVECIAEAIKRYQQVMT